MLRTLPSLVVVALAACAGAESRSNEPTPVLAGSTPVAPQETQSPAGSPPIVTNDPAPPVPVDDKRPFHTLRWVTKGGSNLGYDVFRAESEDGPFIKVNEALIPGSGERFVDVTEFVWADRTIESGKVYWYYIESVDLMRKRARFTPVQRVEPKAAAGAAAVQP